MCFFYCAFIGFVQFVMPRAGFRLSCGLFRRSVSRNVCLSSVQHEQPVP